MKSYFSHTVLKVVQRLADAPEQTLSSLAARLSTPLQPEPTATEAPEHIVMRLENAFDAMSELPFQPDVGSALELACDTLQAELPAQSIAAGLYNIDVDEVRIVAARGMEQDLLRGANIPLAHCFAGREPHAPFVIDGGTSGASWLGTGEDGGAILLCPIAHDGRLIGVLAVAEPLCAATFDDHDIELVSYLAGQLASFIHTARQRPSIPAPGLARRA